MPQTTESGVRRNELYFARETEAADGTLQTPTDPSWLLYSTVVNSFETESTPEWDERVGIGNYIGQDKNRQQESHEVTVNYDLEQFPVDASDNPQDAFADASLRNIDNQVQQTHSILQIQRRADQAVESTVHYQYFTEEGNTHPGVDPGASARASRTVVYARGGMPEEATLTLDPGDTAVAEAELSYTAHKLRRYQIDEPAGSMDPSYIHVRSTDSTDTNATVEIESEDGATSESLSLDGTDATTAVGSTSTYSNVRVYLPSDINGTLEVYDDDGSGTNAAGAPEHLLTVIRGKTARDGVEGDTGIPMLGAGSFQAESALGSGVEANAVGDITWSGSGLAQQVMDTELTVSNELESNTTSSGLVQDVNVAGQEITVESTVYGETESAQQFDTLLAGNEGAYVIPLTDGDIKMPRAYCESGGDTELEAENAVMQVEVGFRALEPSSGDPLDFIHS